MKLAQLGVEAGGSALAGSEPEPGEPDARAEIPIRNEIGLHARPAALVVELAGRFDADLRLAKQGGAGPVSARSLTGLMTLVARKGDRLLATASGPQAAEAVAALEELASGGFGEGAAVGVADAPAPPRVLSEPVAPATPPETGSELTGIPASAGIAVGPARRLEQTLEVVRKARSSSAFTFQYSKRPGTPAATSFSFSSTTQFAIRRKAVTSDWIPGSLEQPVVSPSQMTGSELPQKIINGSSNASTGWIQHVPLAMAEPDLGLR